MKFGANKTRPSQILIFCVVLCLLLSSCGRRSGEDSISSGQLDEVGCFLFIFDNRSAQQQLVRDMDNGDVPTRMTCQLYDVVRNVDGTEVEEPVSGKWLESEDEEYIRKVYYAITDLIVVGQMGILNNDLCSSQMHALRSAGRTTCLRVVGACGTCWRLYIRREYRSRREKLNYFGRAEARGREIKNRNTEVGAKCSITSVKRQLEAEKSGTRIPKQAPKAQLLR